MRLRVPEKREVCARTRHEQAWVDGCDPCAEVLVNRMPHADQRLRKRSDGDPRSLRDVRSGVAESRRIHAGFTMA